MRAKTVRTRSARRVRPATQRRRERPRTGRGAAIAEADDSDAREEERLLSCMNQMSQLGMFRLENAQENRAKAHKHSGSSLWLAMRKGGGQIQRGNERLLLCPN